MGALHVDLLLLLGNCVPSWNEGHAPKLFDVLIADVSGPCGGLTFVVLHQSLIICLAMVRHVVARLLVPHPYVAIHVLRG